MHADKAYVKLQFISENVHTTNYIKYKIACQKQVN